MQPLALLQAREVKRRCVPTLFSTDCQANTWSVRFGQLLLAAKKQDADAFYEKLKLVRKEQVVPLSAASYECGTYQRGYEYIVRCVCALMPSGSLCCCVVVFFVSLWGR